MRYLYHWGKGGRESPNRAPSMHWLVNHNTPTPPVFSDVWQAKDLQESNFVCAAGKGVTGGFCVCVAGKGVSAEREQDLDDLRRSGVVRDSWTEDVGEGIGDERWFCDLWARREISCFARLEVARPEEPQQCLFMD
jgi:hypothetical protein